MSDIVERAEAALKGVAAGPWTWVGDSFTDAAERRCPHGTQWTDHGPNLVRCNPDGSTFEEWADADEIITSGGYDASNLDIKTADAEFIMAARDLVPELVAALKAARAQRDQDLEDFAKNYTHLMVQLIAHGAEPAMDAADPCPDEWDTDDD